MISTAESGSGVDGSSLPDDELIAPDTVIGERYRVLGLIGHGGMGSVYLAENLRAGGTVAIKVLRFQWSRNPALARRFRNEAKLTNYAEHPNIVKVLDCAELPDGRFYLVMEFVTGTTLAAELADHGAMPVGRVCRIARAIACAINASHANDVVHRDLKTENVMLTRYDGDDAEFVKVVDFGVSALLQDTGAVSRLTRPGQSVGTPEYMAPEQAMGKPPSVAFDIYALGVVVFEMLTGDPPFVGGGAIEIMARKAMEPAPSLIGRRDDIPLQLAFLVDDCLQREPSKRPATAGEFLRRIDEILRTVGREEAAGYAGHARPLHRLERSPANASAATAPRDDVDAPAPRASERAGPRLDLRPIGRDQRAPTPVNRTGDAPAPDDGARPAPRRATTPGPAPTPPPGEGGETDGVIQQRRTRRRPAGQADSTHASAPLQRPVASERDPGRPDPTAPPVDSGVRPPSHDVVEAIEVEYEREPSRISTAPVLAAGRGPQLQPGSLTVRQTTPSEVGHLHPGAAPRRHVVFQTVTLALAGVGAVALIGLVLGRPLFDDGAKLASADPVAALALHGQRPDHPGEGPSAIAASAAVASARPPASAAVASTAKVATNAATGADGSATPDRTPTTGSPAAPTAPGRAAPPSPREPAAEASKASQRRQRRTARLNTEECVQQRDAADAARRAHAWDEVVTLTRSSGCWRSAPRSALRTQALFQLGRFEECIKAGRGRRHSTTEKFVRLCRARLNRGSSP
ncbi:MAG: hypothetical protein B7733_18225 [Myxococcales bacterium FL481]|nr:MAG: hypothetical protein B7733_18225 [Myxococcales bacterium FL481]